MTCCGDVGRQHTTDPVHKSCPAFGVILHAVRDEHEVLIAVQRISVIASGTREMIKNSPRSLRCVLLLGAIWSHTLLNPTNPTFFIDVKAKELTRQCAQNTRCLSLSEKVFVPKVLSATT